MKVLIIEDEQLTAQNLEKMIGELIPDAEVVGILPSVKAAVEWFGRHPMPDMAFMDIHLADGSSFSIFEKVDITCPIIFTTAYDEYALKAFEVNSVDYLLKPVGKAALERALEKLKRLSAPSQAGDNTDLIRKVAETILHGTPVYKSSLLVSVKDKFIPIKVKDIAYIYFEDKKSVAVRFDGSRSTLNSLLDEIMKQLDPSRFYRANRQFIISRSAVRDITVWFGSRVVVNLTVDVPEKIIVSRTHVQDFKKWVTE